MKKYFIYLLIYSFLGYMLERIINIIAYKELTNGGLLYGPYQPIYGTGIVMAIIVNTFFISKLDIKKYYKDVLLLLTAILTTCISEAVTGFGYDYFYGISLWNYNEFFTCQNKYICLVPTTLFGFGSFLVIKYFHTYVKNLYLLINDYVYYALLALFTIDVVLTFAL